MFAYQDSLTPKVGFFKICVGRSYLRPRGTNRRKLPEKYRIYFIHSSKSLLFESLTNTIEPSIGIEPISEDYKSTIIAFILRGLVLQGSLL